MSAHQDLERLYREQGTRPWRAVFLYTRDAEVAGDAVAEAFAQALRRGDALHSPATWVWTVAFHVAAGETKAVCLAETVAAWSPDGSSFAYPAQQDINGGPPAIVVVSTGERPFGSRPASARRASTRSRWHGPSTARTCCSSGARGWASRPRRQGCTCCPLREANPGGSCGACCSSWQPVGAGAGSP